MSAPQLADAGTSSEWFRKVGGSEATEKPLRASQSDIVPSRADARRRRFARLVTYTMVGLVAFTLLGVTSFLLRQRAMQNALAAPVPATPAVSPTPPPALASETRVDTPTPAVAPPAPAAAAPVATHAPSKTGTSKPIRKSARSPFLSGSKSTTAKR